MIKVKFSFTNMDYLINYIKFDTDEQMYHVVCV